MKIVVVIDDDIDAAGLLAAVEWLPSDDADVVVLFERASGGGIGMTPTLASDPLVAAKALSGLRAEHRRATDARVAAAGVAVRELDAEVRALRDGAAEAVIAAAEAESADLIVVGSRAHTPRSRWSGPSLEETLATSAPCPVLVLR